VVEGPIRERGGGEVDGGEEGESGRGREGVRDRRGRGEGEGGGGGIRCRKAGEGGSGTWRSGVPVIRKRESNVCAHTHARAAGAGQDRQNLRESCGAQ